MLKQFLFFCLFIHIFSVTLKDVKVIGGNYDSHYQFILSGITDELIQKSQNEKIKILIDKEEKETICSVEETQPNELAKYFCKYSERINVKHDSYIYLKKKQNNISGLGDNLRIEPMKITIKSKEITNLKIVDSNLEFNLKTKFQSVNRVLLKYIFYLDITDNNNNNYLGECEIISEENDSSEDNSKRYNSKCIIYYINTDENTMIRLSKNSPHLGTVTFSPSLNSDLVLINFASLNFVSLSNLKFNENNKWEFNINIAKKSIVIGSNFIIDIIYNGEKSTANCNAIKDYLLYCVSDNKNQSKSDLVQLNFVKTKKSSVTWITSDSLKSPKRRGAEITLNMS